MEGGLAVPEIEKVTIYKRSLINCISKDSYLRVFIFPRFQQEIPIWLSLPQRAKEQFLPTWKGEDE